MIKRINLIIMASLLVGLLSAGCDSGGNPSVGKVNGNSHSQTEQAAETTKPVQNTTISIWSYDAALGTTLDKFKSQNKGIDVVLSTFSYGESNEKYLKALSDGTGPDLFMIDSTYFGQYLGIDALQNLLEEPFSAGKYKQDFPESLWDSNLSLDGKKLLAMPIATGPRVTYYREDILRENGFPSEPDGLGVFMENPENWLAIAKKLKENDQYIIQWASDPTEMMGTTVGLFDRKLNFLRNSDLFRRGLDIEKVAQKSAFVSNIDLWSDAGLSAVKTGKLAMLYLGPWGADTIKKLAPNTKGNWRVTRLPFGLYGWSGSTVVTMNAQSKNKEAAWKLMEFIATNKGGSEQTSSIPAYIPARKNPKDLERPDDFLGGQKAYAYYDKLADRMKEYTLTPLDDSALEIFRQGIIAAIENDIDSTSALKSISNKVDSSLAEEKEILLQYIDK